MSDPTQIECAARLAEQSLTYLRELTAAAYKAAKSQEQRLETLAVYARAAGHIIRDFAEEATREKEDKT